MKMDKIALILATVGVVLSIIALIINVVAYRGARKVVVAQQDRIKFLEENAYIRGDRGRFQKLIPKAESTVPAANG
jgi:hypothetical protein